LLTLTAAATATTGSFTFAFGGTGITASSPTAGTATVNVAGVYSVTVTNTATGLTSTTTTTVYSNTVAPTATLAGSQTITSGQAATLTATLTGSGLWRLTLTNGLTFSTIASSPFAFTVLPMATTTYTLASVTDLCGTGSVSGSAVVTVQTNCPGGMVSVKSGNWNDPATWSCNRVPTLTDIVKITPTHIVTLPDNLTGYVLTLQNFGKVVFGTGAKLQFGQ
jgi:hypothetical protein